MAPVLTKKERAFVTTVKEFYRRHKRRKLPWRQTTNPYHILVSEIMLQQTQVERVVPKYTEFLREFPTLEILAHAPLARVLRVWQGLGYNRRAKMLHECANVVVEVHNGALPRAHDALRELPGIGAYTTGALMAFAFGEAVPIVETNIRSVYLYHFFEYDTDVTDSALMPYIERTLDRKNPRAWYYALMDYGTYIKKMYGNPNRRSKHHTRQSAFKGSDREIRGAIIRLLTTRPHSRRLIQKLLKHFSDLRIDAQLSALANEGLIMKDRRMYCLPE